jgi:hypothetical protein
MRRDCMFNPTDSLEVNLDRAAGDVIDGEAIIINLTTGVYYSMQGIGGEIWAMLNERRTFGAMLDAIAATYDVTGDVARRDLDTVLGQLLEEGLIQVASTPAPEHAAPAADTKKPYQPPSLQVYRDMQELLALDPPAPGMNQIAWNERGTNGK